MLFIVYSIKLKTINKFLIEQRMKTSFTLFFYFIFINIYSCFCQNNISINHLKIEIEGGEGGKKGIIKIANGTLMVVLNEDNTKINDLIKKTFENYWTFNHYEFLYSKDINNYFNKENRSFLFFGYNIDKHIEVSTYKGVTAPRPQPEGYGFSIVSQIENSDLKNLETNYCNYFFHTTGAFQSFHTVLSDSVLAYVENSIIDRRFGKENDTISNYWDVLTRLDEYIIAIKIIELNNYMENLYAYIHKNYNECDPPSKFRKLKLDGLNAQLTIYKNSENALVNNEVLVLDYLSDSLGYARLNLILPNTKFKVVNKEEILQALLNKDQNKLILADPIHIRKLNGEKCATIWDPLFSIDKESRKYYLKKHLQKMNKGK